MMNYQILILCISFVLVKATEDDDWFTYKKTNSKLYSIGEELIRRQAWRENLVKIRQAPNGFTLKMNKFGDLTQDEVQRKLLGFKIPVNTGKERKIDTYTRAKRSLPAYVDWRNNKYVTPVKDQTVNNISCSACYVFAASAALEGQWAKKLNILQNMSEQDFLDCSVNGSVKDTNGIVEPKPYNGVNVFQYSVFGCNGGNIDAIYQYSFYNGYIPTFKLPYRAQVY